MRNDIINTTKNEQIGENKQKERPNFDWLHRSKEELENLIKNINLD